MSQGRGSVRKTFDLGNLIIVKLRKGKKTFEMIADPKEAWNAKKLLKVEKKEGEVETKFSVDDILGNKDIALSDVFQTYDVYSNVKKGDRCTDEDLTTAFDTTELRTIAASFLLDGEFSWTKAQRAEWLEKKKKQIITILSRNSINPQTKKPHPAKRIEKAMEEAKVSIDLNLSAEGQVDLVLKKIQLVIPIRMETIQMAVKVPAVYAAKAYNTVDKYSQIKKSEWQTDGSWIGMVSMPAGLQMEMLEKLNALTHGRVQTKLIQK